MYGKQTHPPHRTGQSLYIDGHALPPRRGGGDEPSRMLQNQPLVLASYQSKPLIEDVRVINKVSQNLHAEILLRLLGREKGTAGTVEGGLEVLRGFLNQAGIPSDQYVFYDGSGLSRQNLVTPRRRGAVAALRRHPALGGQFPRYAAAVRHRRLSLPIVSRMRSAGTRARKDRFAGRSEDAVRVCHHQSRRPVAFSIFSNNFNLPDKRINETIDSIVAEILNDDKPKK